MPERYKLSRRSFIQLAGWGLLGITTASDPILSKVSKKLETASSLGQKNPQLRGLPTPEGVSTEIPAATGIPSTPELETGKFDMKPLQSFGVNLAGGEFGEIPGVLNANYTYPDSEYVKLWSNLGVPTFRYPFRFERVIKNGDLTSDINIIHEVLNAAKTHNVKVILDSHNYARIWRNGNEVLLSPDELADNWGAISRNIANHPALAAYGIVNEPYSLNEIPKDLQEKTIYKIRENDTNTPLLITSSCYSGAREWKNCNTGLELLAEQAQKLGLAFEAHYYIGDSSGSFNCGLPAACNANIDQIETELEPFVSWLKQYNVQGFVGEIGVPYQIPEWQPHLQKALNYLDSNKIGATLWAAGPWWPDDYPLSLNIPEAGWVITELNRLNAN